MGAASTTETHVSYQGTATSANSQASQTSNNNQETLSKIICFKKIVAYPVRRLLEYLSVESNIAKQKNLKDPGQALSAILSSQDKKLLESKHLGSLSWKDNKDTFFDNKGAIKSNIDVDKIDTTSACQILLNVSEYATCSKAYRSKNPSKILHLVTGCSKNLVCCSNCMICICQQRKCISIDVGEIRKLRNTWAHLEVHFPFDKLPTGKEIEEWKDAIETLLQWLIGVSDKQEAKEFNKLMTDLNLVYQNTKEKYWSAIFPYTSLKDELPKEHQNTVKFYFGITTESPNLKDLENMHNKESKDFRKHLEIEAKKILQACLRVDESENLLNVRLSGLYFKETTNKNSRELLLAVSIDSKETTMSDDYKSVNSTASENLQIEVRNVLLKKLKGILATKKIDLTTKGYKFSSINMFFSISTSDNKGFESEERNEIKRSIQEFVAVKEFYNGLSHYNLEQYDIKVDFPESKEKQNVLCIVFTFDYCKGENNHIVFDDDLLWIKQKIADKCEMIIKEYGLNEVRVENVEPRIEFCEEAASYEITDKPSINWRADASIKSSKMDDTSVIGRIKKSDFDDNERLQRKESYELTEKPSINPRADVSVKSSKMDDTSVIGRIKKSDFDDNEQLQRKEITWKSNMSQLRGHFQPEQIQQRFAIRRTQLQGLREIGCGVGVTVETAIWTKIDGQREEVVMKKYRLRSDCTQYKRAFHREVIMLANLNHRNIVRFYGFCDDGILAIVMEKAEISLLIGGSQKICHSLREILGEYKANNKDLPFSTKTIALHQICKGLQYLHDKRILHNDLKSENVLVFSKNDDKLIFKICNFGECRRELIDIIRSTTSESNLNNGMEAKKTAPYISPERFKDSLLIDQKSDIYSLAMLMYELLRPELDFPWQEELKSPSYNEIEKRVLNGERPGFQEKSSFRMHLHENLEKIIEYCWQQDPEHRPDIDQVLDLVSLLKVKGDKEKFLHGIEDDYLKLIYDKLFDDPSLAYDFVKEVSKWNKVTITNLSRYFDELIVALRSREKKLNIIDLAANSTAVVAGVTGIVGFGLLFTPFTFVPGVILCATASAVGASGGIASGSVMIHKNRKDKQAKKAAKAEFKKAGIDMDAFAKLLKEIYDLSQDLSKDFQSIDQEYTFGAIHGFLLRVWGLLQELATTDLVMQDVEGLEKGCNNVSDFAGAAATVNTFSTLAKSAQVLQSIGLVFSILDLDAGIYGMSKNSIKIHKGSENEVTVMLNVYKTFMNQFWRIKVIVQPNLDE